MNRSILIQILDLKNIRLYFSCYSKIKIFLEMNYIYENFETNTDFRNDNKLKFDQFECQGINNIISDN